MSRSNVIAIVGGAASGKTAVGKRVADRLSARFVSTGLTLRAIAHDLRSKKSYGMGDVRNAMYFKPWVEVSDPLAEELMLNDGYAKEASDWMQDKHTLGVFVAKEQVLVDDHRNKGLVIEGRRLAQVLKPDSVGLHVFLTTHLDARAERRSAQTGEPIAACKEKLRLRDVQDGLTADGSVCIQTADHDVEWIANRIIEKYNS